MAIFADMNASRPAAARVLSHKLSGHAGAANDLGCTPLSENMQKRLDGSRIIVVGAGLIGKKHIDLVTRHASLAAIVDPNTATEELARRHGAPLFADIDAALTRTEADGAIIASPNTLHLDHARATLSTGLPTLVEKPLTDTLRAARSLMEAEAAIGHRVLVGHHRRHSPIVEVAKTELEKGTLGHVVTVNALFWLNKPNDYFDAKWRTEKGGGPVSINLIHDIDLLHYLAGPIKTVQARLSNAQRGFAIEDTGAAIFEFESGAIGTASFSDTVTAPWSWELTAGENDAYPKTGQSCYQIAGTDAALSIPDLHIWRHDGAQSWWSPMGRRRLDVTPTDPVAAQFVHFLDVIHGRAAPKVSAADGARAIAVVEAIQRAAASGRAEDVDF